MVSVFSDSTCSVLVKPFTTDPSTVHGLAFSPGSLQDGQSALVCAQQADLAADLAADCPLSPTHITLQPASALPSVIPDMHDPHLPEQLLSYRKNRIYTQLPFRRVDQGLLSGAPLQGKTRPCSTKAVAQSEWSYPNQSIPPFDELQFLDRHRSDLLDSPASASLLDSQTPMPENNICDDHCTSHYFVATDPDLAVTKEASPVCKHPIQPSSQTAASMIKSDSGSISPVTKLTRLYSETETDTALSSSLSLTIQDTDPAMGRVLALNSPPASIPMKIHTSSHCEMEISDSIGDVLSSRLQSSPSKTNNSRNVRTATNEICPVDLNQTHRADTDLDTIVQSNYIYMDQFSDLESSMEADTCLPLDSHTYEVYNATAVSGIPILDQHFSSLYNGAASSMNTDSDSEDVCSAISLGL
ncbi:hypothetical protein BASA83_009858 [Batrachochytrium salamandrivorans]|nr:hypothetical protein BASA83_009858 [Batrachochytrium salamandrivorans]